MFFSLPLTFEQAQRILRLLLGQPMGEVEDLVVHVRGQMAAAQERMAHERWVREMAQRAPPPAPAKPVEAPAPPAPAPPKPDGKDAT